MFIFMLVQCYEWRTIDDSRMPLCYLFGWDITDGTVGILDTLVSAEIAAGDACVLLVALIISELVLIVVWYMETH